MVAGMVATIRPYLPNDEGAVVALSLRTWAPNFASMERILGAEIHARLHGDWEEYQAISVRNTLRDDDVTAWVAARDGAVVGFVAATLNPSRLLGEIGVLAVDPADQDHGVGTALTEFATGWMREAGMRVAMIGTGGDEGHAAARRVYEKADYTVVPMARYFKAL